MAPAAHKRTFSVARMDAIAPKILSHRVRVDVGRWLRWAAAASRSSMSLGSRARAVAVIYVATNEYMLRARGRRRQQQRSGRRE